MNPLERVKAAAKAAADLTDAIVAAKDAGYKMTDIANAANRHPNTVYRRYRQAKVARSMAAHPSNQ